MSGETLGLGPVLKDYLRSVCVRESELLRELRQVTAQRDDSMMQIAPEQGQLMSFLVKLTGAKRILEIGTFTGYSALVMAQALPSDGRLVTLDVNEETAKIAQSYWERGGVRERIELRLGAARDTLKSLEGPFDLAFIDADKSNYGFYYEHALKLLRSGGLILIDNVLWSGRVADEQVQDDDTRALRALNKKIAGDERVDCSLVPIADGVFMVRKR